MNVRTKAYVRQLSYWITRIFEWPMNTYGRLRIRFLMITRTPNEVIDIIKSEISEDTKQALRRMKTIEQALCAVARTKILQPIELSLYRALIDLANGRFYEDPEETDRLCKLLFETNEIPDHKVATETVLLCVELNMLNPSELLSVQDILKQQNVEIDLGKSMTLKVSD